MALWFGVTFVFIINQKRFVSKNRKCSYCSKIRDVNAKVFFANQKVFLCKSKNFLCKSKFSLLIKKFSLLIKKVFLQIQKFSLQIQKLSLQIKVFFANQKVFFANQKVFSANSESESCLLFLWTEYIHFLTQLFNCEVFSAPCGRKYRGSFFFYN